MVQNNLGYVSSIITIIAHCGAWAVICYSGFHKIYRSVLFQPEFVISTRWAITALYLR